MTLEMLIAWHQQRAADCFDLVKRVTHMPKVDADALKGNGAIPYRSGAPYCKLLKRRLKASLNVAL